MTRPIELRVISKGVCYTYAPQYTRVAVVDVDVIRAGAPPARLPAGIGFEELVDKAGVKSQVVFVEDGATDLGAEADAGAIAADAIRSWCCTEGTSYSFEELGDDAWLTGCPLCGSSSCGSDLTPDQIAERDEFYRDQEDRGGSRNE